MVKEKIKRGFFIVGCPRSGTTLLQSLLAVHPQIASLPETHFFPYTVGRRWRRLLGISSPKAKERLYQFLSDIDHSEMKSHVPKHAFLVKQYINAFINILDTLTINQGKNFWVEKTPMHLHFIDIIEKYIPNVRFIHIVRNGKDVVASLYEVTHRYPEEWGGRRSIEECIDRWNRDVKITQQYIHKENHTLVRYEQFTENPEVVLRNLCKFMGVEFSQLMLEQHGMAAEKVILDNQEWVKSAKGKIMKWYKNRKFNRLFDEREQKFIISHLEKLI